MKAKIVLCKRWTKLVLHIIFRNARFISSRHWFYGNTIVFHLVQKLKLFVEFHSLPALKVICQKDNGHYIILDSYVWWWSSSWCFCGMVDQWKTFSLISSQDHFKDLHQPESPIRCKQAGTCTEPVFRLCWMKLCSSDNHSIMALQWSSIIYRQILMEITWYWILLQLGNNHRDVFKPMSNIEDGAFCKNSFSH